MANKVAGNPLVSVCELQATLGAEPLTGLGWNALAFAPNCNVPLKRNYTFSAGYWPQYIKDSLKKSTADYLHSAHCYVRITAV
jgi:hypothetical protein